MYDIFGTRVAAGIRGKCPFRELEPAGGARCGDGERNEEAPAMVRGRGLVSSSNWCSGSFGLSSFPLRLRILLLW